jgi:hypothetical protein
MNKATESDTSAGLRSISKTEKQKNRKTEKQKNRKTEKQVTLLECGDMNPHNHISR